MDETLSHIYSTDEEKSKVIIVDESSMEESKDEYIHKNIHKEKDGNNEADYEEPTIKYDKIFKEPRYFNVFKCGKNPLNKLDATYEQTCMETPSDK